MDPHRIFYHADLAGTLSEHQELVLNANGVSRFGQAYEPYFGQPYEYHSGAIRRELMLERVRTHNPNVAGRVPSRFRCVFAALTAHDAKVFAHKSVNRIDQPIKVFEIIAPPGSFYFRDMGWLDMSEGAETASYCVSYWSELLTRNVHENPYIEVCIELPARAGRVVDEFTQSDTFIWRAPKLDAQKEPPA